MKIHHLFIISILAILSSCQKPEWNNPFGRDCPKDIWTPTNFKAVQVGTAVTLTWSQPLKNIGGFKLTKKVDTGVASDLQNQTKDATQFVDASLTGGKVHTYTITAFAGSNLSNTVTIQITPILSAGITTTAVSAITSTSLTSGGTITTDGGAAITARGVCWSTTGLPTIANSKTTDGTGTGAFSSAITGLTPGANYNIRAYATNSVGTSYGNQVTTTVSANLPVLTTTTPSAVTTTTAISGGIISSDGGGTVTARGVCWSTSSGPTVANNKTTDANGPGSFISNISGLSPATTYYVRAYATNSSGTNYGQQEIFVSSYGTVSDVDGNTYQTVKIGTQIWTRENLKTTKYKDGTAIPLITDNTAWSNLSSPGYCWYNNDAATNKNTYGALYNWYSVNTNKLCPTGWHVPTDADWTVLTTYLGGESVAGGKLKETGTSHWYSPNISATNETGFTAVPGGFREDNGPFYNVGYYGSGWSSTESSALYAWTRGMRYDYSVAERFTYNKQYGFSVRCISGEIAVPTISTSTSTNITSTSASTGGTISNDGGAQVTARGVCWSTTNAPTISNSKTSDGTGIGSFTSNLTALNQGTTYYVRAYATNSSFTAYGNQVSFTTSPVSQGTVTDADGNSYSTVTIGTQVWMGSNLKTTKYKDGTAIPLVTDNTAWSVLSTPGYCWYNNDAATNKSNYGALYNWFTVNTGKLCPTGWHVPSDTEWTTLITFLGGETVAGGKLKETGTSHWLIPNTGATNETGFTALPGGFRYSNGAFSDLGGSTCWWPSTESSTAYAWYRGIAGTSGGIGRSEYVKQDGFSVRCISGELTLPTLTTASTTSITATSATSGGNISSDGGTAVTARGVCWSTTNVPTISNSKTSDGTGIGSFTSSITGLTAGTTYYVRAYATNSAGTAYGNHVSMTTNTVPTTVTDNDGNVYNVVTIGTQFWMSSNLKTTRYNDNTSIPLVIDNISWENLTTPGYCWYNNDATTNKNVYGALYNWYSVNTGKLCPTGWHVPTNDEWITLVLYLGGDAVAGGKLRETGIAHWVSPNEWASNSSGFSALPGGNRYTDGRYFEIGNVAFFWSATGYAPSNAYDIYMSYNNSRDVRSQDDKQRGLSIRCLNN